MILILDDTFYLRSRYNDITYVEETKYKAVCEIIQKPTQRNFKEILSKIDNYKLLCNHRSLNLYTGGDNTITDVEFLNKTKNNFYVNFRNKGIRRIEFGRDMHTNFEVFTIDKNLFYENLKPFLDHYITNSEIELKILFFGENYNEAEKMTLADKLIDIIISSNEEELKNNNEIPHIVKKLFYNADAHQLIENWLDKNFTKKDMIQFINNNI